MFFFLLLRLVAPTTHESSKDSPFNGPLRSKSSGISTAKFLSFGVPKGDTSPLGSSPGLSPKRRMIGSVTLLKRPLRPDPDGELGRPVVKVEIHFLRCIFGLNEPKAQHPGRGRIQNVKGTMHFRTCMCLFMCRK